MSSLVKRAGNVDLSVYVECEKLAICCTKCYNRLMRFKNTMHKVDEIRNEIQSNFQGDVPLRFKRLSKDYSGTPDAKRGLNFGGPGSSSDQKKLQGKASVVHAIPVASPGLSLIPIGVTNLSEVLTQGFVPPRPQNQLLEKAFMDAMPVVMLTSTLLADKVATHANSSNADSQEKETSVHLTVKCAIKPVHKELKDDYAAISKPIVYGPPQRIARAASKNDTLKKCIVEKVLQLVTLQLNGLCSRRQPSMLRANTKEGITQFDFKKLCLE